MPSRRPGTRTHGEGPSRQGVAPVHAACISETAPHAAARVNGRRSTVRFILRRLVFYVIAFWAAITLNFLLPRLMPGSPARRADPPLRHGDPEQPRPHQAAEGVARVGGRADLERVPGTTSTTSSPATSACRPRSRCRSTEIIGNTLPYSIFLVGIGFILSFVIGTFLGMLAAWRRGGITDRVGTPGLMALQSFPAFFLSLVAVYFLGLKLGWFPIQHAYSNDSQPGDHLVVPRGLVPPRPAADPRDHRDQRRRLAARDAQRDDHDGRRRTTSRWRTPRASRTGR